MTMYNKFISYENFYLAYKRLQTTQYDYYKELYKEDLYNFGLNLEENLKTLIYEVEENVYKPEKPHKLYIPKINRTVRPITVLNFIDMLVYQSIVNVIADEFYDKLEPYYNRMVFGNICNYEQGKKNIFFFVNWKRQWKKYEQLTKQYYYEGFKYILNFDLASFYEIIDHYLLLQILKENKIDQRIVELLQNQLQVWTIDRERKNFILRHGIPQGPIASRLLSEIYLNYIDKKIKKLIQNECNIRYIRYADDIRLFTKNKESAQRFLAYLDLLVKDLGLIPQVNKVKIEKVTNIYELLKNSNNFSRIAKEFKSRGKLSKKSNDNLTKKVIKTLEKKEFDKTILKFSLFRISKNEKVKDLLLENSDHLFHLYDGICEYLSRYFCNDDLVKEWVINQIYNDNYIYKWIIAVLFKYFYRIIPFDSDLFKKYYKTKIENIWYIKYYLLDWIKFNKPQYLKLIEYDSSSIINKKLLKYRLDIIDDIDIKKSLIDDIIKNEDTMLAIQGSKIAYEIEYNIINKSMNTFLQSSIRKKRSCNYIAKILSNRGIVNADVLFNNSFWEPKEYESIKWHFHDIEKKREIDPNSCIISMDNFNHLITIKLLELKRINIVNKKQYANLLEKDNYLKDSFPETYRNFKRIHKRRNDVAHPLSEIGRLANRISWKELSQLIKMEYGALREIVDSFRLYYNDIIEEASVTKK